MTYKERCAQEAKKTGKNNYDWTVWAAPENDKEKAIIEFLKKKHPNTITLTMQEVVDDIGEFIDLNKSGWS